MLQCQSAILPRRDFAGLIFPTCSKRPPSFPQHRRDLVEAADAGVHFHRLVEAVLVDFRTQSQRSPEYLAVNPKGRVPALVTESGTLTETPALLCFVAQRFPKAELAPLADPFALARVQEFNSYLCSTVHVAHAHGRRGARWADDAAAIEAMKRKVPANVTECFELIGRKLMKGPWVMGDQYTICDPYLFTIASWIEGDGVDTTKLPRVMEHRARMLARPAVQKAVAAEGTQIP